MASSLTNKERVIYLQSYLKHLQKNSSQKIIKTQFLNHVDKLSSKPDKVRWYLALARVYIQANPGETIKYAKIALDLDKKNQEAKKIIYHAHQKKKEASIASFQATPSADYRSQSARSQGQFHIQPQTVARQVPLKEPPSDDHESPSDFMSSTVVGVPSFLNKKTKVSPMAPPVPLQQETTDHDADDYDHLTFENQSEADQNSDRLESNLASLVDQSITEDLTDLSELDYPNPQPPIYDLSDSSHPSHDLPLDNVGDHNKKPTNENVSPSSSSGDTVLEHYLEELINQGKAYLALIVLSSLADTCHSNFSQEFRSHMLTYYQTANSALGRELPAISQTEIAALSHDSEVTRWRLFLKTSTLPKSEEATLL
ncbi:MAG: hypothetical protein OXC40_03225 [Proteobacteria bacterium]|nr:hypothetical protein [Pseudomonadota bacterium]